MNKELMKSIREILREELEPIKSDIKELKEGQIKLEEGQKEIKEMLRELDPKDDNRYLELKDSIDQLKEDLSTFEIIIASNYSNIARLKSRK